MLDFFVKILLWLQHIKLTVNCRLNCRADPDRCLLRRDFSLVDLESLSWGLYCHMLREAQIVNKLWLHARHATLFCAVGESIQEHDLEGRAEVLRREPPSVLCSMTTPFAPFLLRYRPADF